MILDTNALSALVQRDRDVLRVTGQVHRWLLPVIVLGEFEYGLLGMARSEAFRREFERLTPRLEELLVDRQSSLSYASLKHRQRLIGRPIPENDLWIAALALQHDLPILSRDAHFDAVEGVTRLGW